jgi:cell division protein ZapA
MAQVTVSVGGRGHLIACRDGEEARVTELAAMLDERYPAATRAAGGAGERAMLFVALMLADDLHEAVRPAPSPDDARLGALAERLEALASALERDAPAS